MSTNNIGFYEDLTKIIFELSSNIIKYAPYFFCCYLCNKTDIMGTPKLGLPIISVLRNSSEQSLGA